MNGRFSKILKSADEAREFHNRLAGRYEYVKLIYTPSEEAGLYVWNVRKPACSRDALKGIV